MASLFSQLAGVLSSVICAFIVVPLGIPGVWGITGGFTVLTAVAAAIRLKTGAPAPTENGGE